MVRWTIREDALVVVFGLAAAGALSVPAEAPENAALQVVTFAMDNIKSTTYVQGNNMVIVSEGDFGKEVMTYRFDSQMVCAEKLGTGILNPCVTFAEMAATTDAYFQERAIIEACEIAQMTGRKNFYEKFCA